MRWGVKAGSKKKEFLKSKEEDIRGHLFFEDSPMSGLICNDWLVGLSVCHDVFQSTLPTGLHTCIDP